MIPSHTRRKTFLARFLAGLLIAGQLPWGLPLVSADTLRTGQEAETAAAGLEEAITAGGEEIDEPQLKEKNPYADALRALLSGPLVTRQSIERRLVLKKIGREVEKHIQDKLGDKDIRIAIVPLGSSLKGYATVASDIEYGLYFLSGGPEWLAGIKKEEIFDEVNRLVSQEGFEGEELMGGITSIPNLGLLSELIEDDLNRGMPLEHLFIQHLFLPVAYGDARLVERARKKTIGLVTHFFGSKSSDRWDEIRGFYLKDIQIEPDSVAAKPFLQILLADQGVNVNSKRAIRNFNKTRPVSLPSLAEMQRIYRLQAPPTSAGLEERIGLRLGPGNAVDFVPEDAQRRFVPGRETAFQPEPPSLLPGIYLGDAGMETDLQRLRTLVLDGYQQVSTTGRFDVDPVIRWARESIHPGFQPRTRGVANPTRFEDFLDDLLWDLFLPTGELARPFRQDGIVVNPRFKLLEALKEEPYLTGPAATRIWVAPARRVEGPEDLAGSAYSDVAVYDRDISSKRRLSFYDSLVESAQGIDEIKELLRRIRKEDEPGFIRLMELRTEDEERQHAQDYAWAFRFFGRNLRKHPGRKTLVAEALVKPGSLLDRTYWTPTKLSRNPKAMDVAGYAIAELSGQVGSHLHRMEVLLREGKDEWAHALFWLFLIEKINEFTKTQKAGPLSSEEARIRFIAQAVVSYVGRRGYNDPQALADYFSRESASPAAVSRGRLAYQFLRGFYDENLLTDPEREQLFNGNASGLEETPMLPAPQTDYKFEDYLDRGFSTLNIRYYNELVPQIKRAIRAASGKPVPILFVGVGRGNEAIGAQGYFGSAVEVWAINKKPGEFYDTPGFAEAHFGGQPLDPQNEHTQAFRAVQGRLKIIDLQDDTVSLEKLLGQRRFPIVVIGWNVLDYNSDGVAILNRLLRETVAENGVLFTRLPDLRVRRPDGTADPDYFRTTYRDPHVRMLTHIAALFRKEANWQIPLSLVESTAEDVGSGVIQYRPTYIEIPSGLEGKLVLDAYTSPEEVALVIHREPFQPLYPDEIRQHLEQTGKLGAENRGIAERLEREKQLILDKLTAMGVPWVYDDREMYWKDATVRIHGSNQYVAQRRRDKNLLNGGEIVAFELKDGRRVAILSKATSLAGQEALSRLLGEAQILLTDVPAWFMYRAEPAPNPVDLEIRGSHIDGVINAIPKQATREGIPILLIDPPYRASVQAQGTGLPWEGLAQAGLVRVVEVPYEERYLNPANFIVLPNQQVLMNKAPKTHKALVTAGAIPEAVHLLDEEVVELPQHRACIGCLLGLVKRSQLREGRSGAFSGLEEQAIAEQLDGLLSAAEGNTAVVIGPSVAARFGGLEELARLDGGRQIFIDEGADTVVRMIAAGIEEARYYGGLEEAGRFETLGRSGGIRVKSHLPQEGNFLVQLHNILALAGVPEPMIQSGLEELAAGLEELAVGA